MTSPLPNDFLTNRRRQLGLTLHQVGAFVGASIFAVHTWEKRRYRAQPRFIPKLAQVLELEPSVIINFFDSKGK